MENASWLIIGLVVGFVPGVWACVTIQDKEIKRGFFEHRGQLYRIIPAQIEVDK